MDQQITDFRLTEYISLIFDTFTELRGDRKSGDSTSVLGGLARINGIGAIVVGYDGDKFSLNSPEGYRKSQRLISLAETFRKPFITFVDIPESVTIPTPQQQQKNESIIRTLKQISYLATPVVSIITGKLNSYQAIDMCAADCILMLENSCCFIPLLKDNQSGGTENRQSICLRSHDLLRLNVIDKIVDGSPEDDVKAVAGMARELLISELRKLDQVHPEELVQQRLYRLQLRFSYFRHLQTLFRDVG